ncbi:hypothetical protein ACPPVW_13270 [Leifsonia sp. McL0607]|uniref:hypothetical protein n=1 Tax=Leifsonia sp. McL0607 TaxID=3415672 RepID=UPI003CEA9286
MTTTGTTTNPQTTANPYGTTPYGTTPYRTLSIMSFALGLASIFFSWTFLAPIAGLVLGVLALGREPQGRTFAIWGIVLNAVMLAGILIGLLLAVIGFGVGLAFLPFHWGASLL